MLLWLITSSAFLTRCWNNLLMSLGSLKLISAYFTIKSFKNFTGMNGKVEFKNCWQKKRSMYSILIWVETSPGFTAWLASDPATTLAAPLAPAGPPIF